MKGAAKSQCPWCPGSRAHTRRPGGGRGWLPQGGATGGKCSRCHIYAPPGRGTGGRERRLGGRATPICRVQTRLAQGYLYPRRSERFAVTDNPYYVKLGVIGNTHAPSNALISSARSARILLASSLEVLNVVALSTLSTRTPLARRISSPAFKAERVSPDLKQASRRA